MSIESLKSTIIAANAAYRAGTPTMSDAEFDSLVEQFQKNVSEDEYNSFRDSLHEIKGKVKHPYVMGSLDKFKIDEPDTIIDFLKTIHDSVNVSAKVDGISCRLHWKDGILTSASTRGDGSFGEDISDKIKYVKHVPEKLSGKMSSGEFDVRGELVILGEDFLKLEGFANPRNATAGIMNRKDWNKDDVSNVSFVAYTILGDKYEKSEQFKMLDESKFMTAWHIDIPVSDINWKTIVSELQKYAETDYYYETDGLVVCSSSYKNEQKYRPDACKAVKINQLTAVTRLNDISWEGPSKDGYFVGVGLIEPVELGGSMISRVTLHNLDFISEKGLKYGSMVTILKSGDVIPKLVNVVSNDETCSEIELPTTCSCCGSELVRDGINLRCMNENCPDQVNHRITHFIKKLGVKSTSNLMLKKFGITSFDDLLRFTADKKSKSETKFTDELYNKVFSRSKKDIFCAMNFKGLAEVTLDKIISYYTFEALDKYLKDDGSVDQCYVEVFKNSGLPSGIGEITLEKFIQGFPEAWNLTYKFIKDVRWHYVQVSSSASGSESGKKNGMSVCFTGSLNTMSRNEASKRAVEAGYEVKSGVSRGLTYLVTNNLESGSSKAKKAKELGTKVIDEKEFIKLVSKIETNELFEI